MDQPATKLRIYTASGSVYDIDPEGPQVRRVERGAASNTERATQAWQRCTSLYCEIGKPLVIVWGTGTDEVSATCEVMGDGPDSERLRLTQTSPVLKVEYLLEA